MTNEYRQSLELNFVGVNRLFVCFGLFKCGWQC